MSVLEDQGQDRGFATVHREVVVGRLVRRLAAVLGVTTVADRLDLSGAGDRASWEHDVLKSGCRQLGVYIKPLDTLGATEALDVVHEGHVVVIPHRDGHYSLIERQLGRRIEVTTISGSIRHGTVPRSAVAALLEDSNGVVFVAQRELDCDSVSAEPDGTDPAERLTPLRRFLRLLRLEAQDIGTVVLFALVSGVLGLATPLAVESLVNVVSWGTYLQPLVVLALILLASLGLAGVLKILQTVVVEIIQRRQLVRIVGDLAHRFPRANRAYLKKYYPRELANRVFDIMTIQKATAILLLDGVSIVLTTCLGMLLLAFYHPFLLGFNIVLLLTMASVTWFLGRGGVRTSIEESMAKYKIAHWLQDVISFPEAFKVNGGEDLAIEHTNQLAAEYLESRERQFRVVIRQVTFAIGLQVFASTALLGLGGWLVIERQLTLGQLVASELVVTVVVGAFAKAGKSLEKFYDLMAGIDKVGHLLDIPVDARRGPLSVGEAACPLEWSDLQLATGASQRSVPAGQLAPGAVLAVTGNDLIAKSLFAESVSGLVSPQSGIVTVADMDAPQAAIAGKGRLVAVATRIEVFHATIMENVRLGRAGIGEDRVREVLKAVGLWNLVHQLPQGVNTTLETGGYPLSRDQLSRLMVARALAARPRLLVIDGVIDSLPPAERVDVLQAVRKVVAPCTVVVTTNDAGVVEVCDRQFELNGLG